MSGGFDEASGFEGARARVCPACGARVPREAARFCSTCGRDLVRGGDYFPSDTLRASYHTQPASERAGVGAGRAGVSAGRAHGRAHAAPRRPLPRTAARVHVADGASATARAFVTYSLVPYLGILFCPGALVAGSLCLVRARRAPQPGARRSSAVVLGLGVAVTGAQVFLWWILYKIPEWVGRF
jgi:hypothetical protein